MRQIAEHIGSRTILLACTLGLGFLSVAGQTRSARQLFLQLQSAQTTDSAEEQLRTLVASDPSAKNYLAEHLPAMIERGPQHHDSHDADSQWPDRPWVNAVALAGELKIAQAAPALANWIKVRVDYATTLYTESSLENSPAGQALVQIGDPAIPVLQRTLSTGKDLDRWQAAYALNLIATPRARDALREHMRHEPDKTLVDFIGKATAK